MEFEQIKIKKTEELKRSGFNALVPGTRKNTVWGKGQPIEKADAWYKRDLFGDGWLRFGDVGKGSAFSRAFLMHGGFTAEVGTPQGLKAGFILCSHRRGLKPRPFKAATFQRNETDGNSFEERET